jgi:two-component system response regulator DesR
MSTRVLVAEDVDVLRDTLVALLELEDDLEVVAELARGDRVVPAALDHHPDVALLDIDLPGTDGLTAAAELRDRLPTCRVLILTGLAAPDHLTRALAAGVSGFLIKDGPADDLVDAVRKVARGEHVFDAQPRSGTSGCRAGGCGGGSRRA